MVYGLDLNLRDQRGNTLANYGIAHMRTNRQPRRLRRALERESLTAQAINRLQGQRIAQWAKDDADRIADQVQRMTDRERTLKRDEQAQSRQAPSHSAIDAATAIYNEHTETEETRRDYLIPRQSLTSRLFLRLFDPVVEAESRQWRQLDAVSKAKLGRDAKRLQRAHPANRAALAREINNQPLNLVTGSDDKIVWRSDKTLLSTVKAGTGDVRVVRQTRNRRDYEVETTDLPTFTPTD